jgi:hypothetical protein
MSSFLTTIARTQKSKLRIALKNASRISGRDPLNLNSPPNRSRTASASMAAQQLFASPLSLNATSAATKTGVDPRASLKPGSPDSSINTSIPILVRNAARTGCRLSVALVVVIAGCADHFSDWIAVVMNAVAFRKFFADGSLFRL